MGKLFSTEEGLAMIAAGELGRHGYATAAYARKLELIDDAFAAEHGLTYGAYRGTLGVGAPNRPGLQGRYALELCDQPEGPSGVFQTVLIEADAVADAGLQVGQRLLVLHRRERVPGFGRIHALCLDAPDLRQAAGVTVYAKTA